MAMDAASATPERRRHAGAGAAEWAAVSGTGAWRVEEVGKERLRRLTGLPARDLRALDRALPYAAPSVAGRDRAVVVSLDSVRAVITASEVLVPGPQDPAAAPLVRELRARLGSTAPAASSPPPQLSDGEAGKDGGVSPPVSPTGGGQDGHALGSSKLLPFEFRALEVCLEVAFKSLEHESSTLEKEAYPALDELSSKVSTLNLERVRQIKSRLVAISGRVQKVREELEHLLDDDMDMAAMHLSEKLAYRSAGQSSRFGTENEASESDDERDDEIEEHEGRSEGVVDENGTTSMDMPLRTNELEGLLEAFFVRIDGALNKLCALREYVDDTEDYINIMLDDKQNQLLQMGVLMSTATLVITGGLLVTGVLAMNIHIPLYKAPAVVFWQTTAGLVGGMVALFAVALLYYRKTGILR